MKQKSTELSIMLSPMVIQALSYMEMVVVQLSQLDDKPKNEKKNKKFLLLNEAQFRPHSF